MAVLSSCQPVSTFHVIPLVVLTLTTILFGDLSLDRDLTPHEWRVGLSIGTLFSIGLYFSMLFTNAFQIRKTTTNKRLFDLYLLLKTPISYLMFFIRVAPLCVMSSICTLLLIGTVLGQPLSERSALEIFIVFSALFSLAHLLVERRRLGQEAWEFTP